MTPTRRKTDKELTVRYDRATRPPMTDPRKNVLHIYTQSCEQMHMHRVSTPRERSPAKQGHILRQIREFSGVFYKTLVINRLDKTASQDILFHITGKPVPHVRKGFSATPDRLIRDLTKAFPECKTCFCEPSYSSLYPEKQFLPYIERHFYAYHDAFIRHSVFCFTIFNCQDFLLSFLYFYA